jgi:hypothetical protein
VLATTVITLKISVSLSYVVIDPKADSRTVEVTS